ncbi:MAG: CvpA family protein [Armatimonadota bacterium]|nr:CvpA family protein [Armatimonadota bacterium]MDR7439578.1 CvpA family protein [Armatimonadota bacterium]MDR7562743.1 CvpA family protein [Armatimonadota bacterium]MDR7568578.1 CvpA family protein [Armatimonadota bacterium]MDR7601042.1 CvpA family protein [Armatimonadota bacterium]
MTWVDWIVLALTLLMILSGLQRGPVRTFLEAFFLALAFGATSRFYKPAAQALFGRDFPWPDWAATVTFLGMLVVLVVVGNYLTAAITGRRAAAGIQILLGGLLGVLKGVVLSMVFLVFLLAAPFAPAVRPDVERSLLAPPLASWEAAAVRSLNGVLPWRIPELGPGGESF